MLRATISLSRTLNCGNSPSTYSVAIDGEISATPDDADAVLERISELFHLAEEALAQEIEHDQAKHVASRQDQQPARADRISHPEGKPVRQPSKSFSGVTPKQLQYLETLAHRHGLSSEGLAETITEVLGRPFALQQLTRRQAGQVIEHLARGSEAGTTTD
jgi:DNA primase